ncbi:hypothetical protein M408DRAFT_332028, partial [Serendipita vermifera MAFF 305830]
MVHNGYETPSDDDSAGTASPVEVESREAPGAKRRMAPSGGSQREAKSRRTGEPGGMSAPGHQASNVRGSASGSGQNPNAPPPGYGEPGGMAVGGHGHSILMDDAYGPRHGQKREELADQKLMDELKKELGDPLMERSLPSQQSQEAARSPPPT